MGASGRRPLATSIRSPAKIGVGAVILELPPSRQSSFPVSGIVAADEVRGVGHQLRPAICRAKIVGVPQDGNSSRSVLPDRLAGLAVQRRQERSLLLVALHDHQVLIEDGRTGRTPLVVRQIVGAHIEPAEIALPQRLAVEIVGV